MPRADSFASVAYVSVTTCIAVGFQVVPDP